MRRCISRFSRAHLTRSVPRAQALDSRRRAATAAGELPYEYAPAQAPFILPDTGSWIIDFVEETFDAGLNDGVQTYRAVPPSDPRFGTEWSAVWFSGHGKKPVRRLEDGTYITCVTYPKQKAGKGAKGGYPMAQYKHKPPGFVPTPKNRNGKQVGAAVHKFVSLLWGAANLTGVPLSDSHCVDHIAPGIEGKRDFSVANLQFTSKKHNSVMRHRRDEAFTADVFTVSKYPHVYPSGSFSWVPGAKYMLADFEMGDGVLEYATFPADHLRFGQLCDTWFTRTGAPPIHDIGNGNYYSPVTTSDGRYPSVNLYLGPEGDKHSKKFAALVHVVVAHVWAAYNTTGLPMSDLFDVDHDDENKNNYAVENLNLQHGRSNAMKGREKAKRQRLARS